MRIVETKPINTGMLLYIVAVTLGLIYFTAQWQMQRDRARAAERGLYSLCNDIRALTPQVTRKQGEAFTAGVEIPPASDIAAWGKIRAALTCEGDQFAEAFRQIAAHEAREGRK